MPKIFHHLETHTCFNQQILVEQGAGKSGEQMGQIGLHLKDA